MLRGFVWYGGVVLLMTSAAAADDFFASKIEPLLKTRCYECHSHESGKMKGGLTLDSRSGWAEGGDSGPTAVPREPDKSLLIQMVRWADEDHQMPPKEKLPAEEIALLEEWVRRGAPDPRESKKPEGEWWSLKPLTSPPPPAEGHPIDAFIAASWKAQGLSPVPPADRRTLLRRLYHDLHGLPPSPEEVEAFEKDPDPKAWEKRVDQLLASPRYGERWARHWLDTVHFADTHGFEHDVHRPHAWRYRDYVIASLNADTPWAQFIQEQLAADALFPDRPELTPALGFLGAGTYDSSAAATATTSFEYLDRDDLVTQTMAAFVSTTANCARCHAHKFDPISQEDYFALQAVFAGIGKGDITYHESAAAAREFQRLTALREAAVRRDAAVLLSPENAAAVRDWEAAAGAVVAWETLAPEVYVSTEGATLRKLPDGSLLGSGAVPDKDVTVLTCTTGLPEVTALRLELLTDESLPAKGPGRASNGNLHLSEVEVQHFRSGVAEPVRHVIQRAISDFDQAGYGIAAAIDGDLKSSWAIHPQVGVPHTGLFVLQPPVKMEPGSRLVVTLRQLQGGSHLLGRFRLSATAAAPEGLRILPASVEQALSIPASQRDEAQRLTIAAEALRHTAESGLNKLPARLTVWAAGRTAVNERGAITFAEPRTIRLLKRGDLSKPGDIVMPGALSAVTALPARFALPEAHDESARRAALARWMSAAENPLTWRSAVNRVWHYHFGRGLCDTPSDFGRMGGVPSHPELLDWLAVWFRDEAKGSLKALHRLILTSAAWQRSSVNQPAAAAVDPDNRLLWRMNRSRLDADTIRDSMLAVSGRLELTMGGPAVQHFTATPGPQSTPVLDYSKFDLDSPAAGRRAIYRLVWRAIADPFMDALDFPDMGMLTPVRSFSASPLQSLALFNNAFVLRQSEHFAARVEGMAADPAGRLRWIVRLAWQREPEAEEAALLGTLAQQHGLAAVCRAVFNSSEFLFID